MQRLVIIAAIAVAAALLLAAVSPAFEGYHIGDCSQTDFAQGAQAAGVSQYDGKAKPLTRLGLRWCKADTDPAGYVGATTTPTDSTSGVTCPDGSTAADMAACPGDTMPSTPPASTRPIQVDCPLDAVTGKPHNNENPTWCFWGVGPGTGAEAAPPPNPQVRTNYNYDVGSSCTWQDDGKNAEGTVEIYTCR